MSSGRYKRDTSVFRSKPMVVVWMAMRSNRTMSANSGSHTCRRPKPTWCSNPVSRTNQVDPYGDLWMSVLEVTGQPGQMGLRSRTGNRTDSGAGRSELALSGLAGPWVARSNGTAMARAVAGFRSR